MIVASSQWISATGGCIHQGRRSADKVRSPLLLVQCISDRFSFSMPDVYSIGLGGGSRVRVDDEKRDQQPTITVGPE